MRTGVVGSAPIQVSIVVPTKTEAVNLPPLLDRIRAAMTGRSYEVLVIDDGSKDGTPEVCERLAHCHPISLCVRPEPVGGLSGAVLHGFARARGEILVVMDADLQHPPEQLPAIIAPLVAGEADFVVGSRHTVGGRMAEQWGLYRRLQSRMAALLAKPLAGPLRDTMSGFFALRRSTYDGAKGLDPLGYKIGLELLCKCHAPRVVEVPIDFGLRLHGRSKLTCHQQLDYIRHLGRLYAFQYPRASMATAFILGLLLLRPLTAALSAFTARPMAQAFAASAIFCSLILLAWHWLMRPGRALRTTSAGKSSMCPIAAFLASSAVVFLAVACGQAFIPNLPDHPSSRKGGIIDAMAAWDGEWYLRIATQGYEFYGRSLQTSIVFFPAYPLVANSLIRITSLPGEVALLIVSNGFLLAAFFMFHRYLRDRSLAAGRESVVGYSLWAMALFPSAFYFHMTYTESMLVFLLILAMHAMRRNWPIAVIALIIGVATATRAVGVALCLPFVFHLWKRSGCNVPEQSAPTDVQPSRSDVTSGSAVVSRQQYRARLARFAASGMLFVPFACWGLILFADYQAWKFGTPLAFAKGQAAWHDRDGSPSLVDRAVGLLTLEPIEAVYTPDSPCYWARRAPHNNALLNLNFSNPIFYVGMAVLLIIGGAKRWLDRPEWLLGAVLLAIPYVLQSDRQGMTSEARYASVVFPAYVVMGQLLARLPKLVAVSLLCVGAIMMGAYAALFTLWYFFY